jgi:hypothetical protein
MDASVGVAEEGGDRLDFMRSYGLIDAILEGSAARVTLVVLEHLINKDYCHRIAAINNQ